MKKHIKKTLPERLTNDSDIWDKVFKNGTSEICGRQPSKNLKGHVCLNNPFYNRNEP